MAVTWAALNDCPMGVARTTPTGPHRDQPMSGAGKRLPATTSPISRYVHDRLRCVVMVGLVDMKSAAKEPRKPFMRTVNGPLHTVNHILFDSQ